MRRYLAHAREFLTAWVDASGSRLDKLDAAGVTGFVGDERAHRSVGSAKILVTVLRFLLLDGVGPGRPERRGAGGGRLAGEPSAEGNRSG